MEACLAVHESYSPFSITNPLAWLAAVCTIVLCMSCGSVSRGSQSGGSTPPLITNVTSGSITSSSSAITWTTDVLASSQVEYGTSTSYGSTTSADPTLVTTHSQSVSGLNAGTIYHFRVHSKSSQGVEAVSSDFTFTTLNAGGALSVAVTSPAGGASVSGTVSVSAAASSGAVGVQFMLDGANLGAEVTTTPFSTSWNTLASTNGQHTLSARARDQAGNTATAAAVTVTVSNVSQGTSDFTTRCSDPNIVRCYGFDTNAVQSYSAPVGVDPSALGNYPTVDTSIYASGGGSLKFVIPSDAEANNAGEFHLDFTDDNSVQFGNNSSNGSEFYVQWRQRFDNNYVNFDGTVAGGGGMKQIIIGLGDAAANGSSYIASSCTDFHIVITNPYYGGFPRMYHNCGTKDDAGYQPLEPYTGDYLYQDAIQCLRSNPSLNCFRYFANEWMTFQIHVKAGTDYSNPTEYGGSPVDSPDDRNYHRDSTVELWMARENQPSVLVLSLTDYDLVQHDVSGGTQPATWWQSHNVTPRYGKVWLLPYDTGRCQATFYVNGITRSNNVVTATGSFDSQTGVCVNKGDTVTVAGMTDASFNGSFAVTQASASSISFNQTGSNASSGGGSIEDPKNLLPAATTWFDELAISKRRLPDPGVTTPNPPVGLRVTNDGTKNTLTWTDNSDVVGSSPATGFAIERCSGYNYTDCYANLSNFQQVATGIVGSSWSDAAGTASSVYTYRVRASNGSGFSAYSNAAMNLPGPIRDVHATANSSSSVTITWSQGAPAAVGANSGVVVQRCTGTYTNCGMTDIQYSNVAACSSLPATATSCVDTSASTGTTYTYRVRSFNAAGSFLPWNGELYSSSYGGASIISQVKTP